MTDLKTPVIMCVAPNGARKVKSDHPAVPLTISELADDAVACRDAGAAMIHMHVRTADGKHTLDPEIYQSASKAVRKAVGPEMIIQITSEAAGVYQAPEQIACVLAARPEAVSLSVREIIPDASHEVAAADFLQTLYGDQVMVQFILYDLEDFQNFLGLRKRGIIPGNRHSVLFVLGKKSENQTAHPEELQIFTPLVDDNIIWSVCAFGAMELACMRAAIAIGGHVRVGFENNLYLEDGSVANGNADIVSRTGDAIQTSARHVATSGEARTIMSIA